MSREHRLIKLIKQITNENLIGDDCAVLPGERLVSSDMLVEGKHFLLPQMKLEDLGWKAIAVNLSDLAAMAGNPEFAVVNIAMPSSLSDEEFCRLYQGMTDCAKAFGCRIVGGDLTASQQLIISVTVMGQANTAGPLMRSGANVNDLVVVSGDFGASALGLDLILQGAEADANASYPLMRHLRPVPRLKEAGELYRIGGAGALMDSSDGLADALIQIAEQSDLGLEIESERIPINAEAKKVANALQKNILELALYGGEDYELVACVKPSAREALAQNSAFSVIGIAVPKKGVRIIDSQGTSFELDQKNTFQHWQ